MSKLEKEIQEILALKQGMRFDQLRKMLLRIGYEQTQSGGGGSHYVFRKAGVPPITIPRSQNVKKVYIKIVADALKESMEAENEKRS